MSDILDLKMRPAFYSMNTPPPPSKSISYGTGPHVAFLYGTTLSGANNFEQSIYVASYSVASIYGASTPLLPFLLHLFLFQWFISGTFNVPTSYQQLMWEREANINWSMTTATSVRGSHGQTTRRAPPEAADGRKTRRGGRSRQGTPRAELDGLSQGRLPSVRSHRRLYGGQPAHIRS